MDSVGQEIEVLAGQSSRRLEHFRSEPVCPVDRRGPATVVELELAQLGPEAWVVTGFVPRGLELIQRGNERLGHIATAEVTVQAPFAVLVRLEAVSYTHL